MMSETEKVQSQIKRGFLMKRGRGMFYKPWHVRSVELDYQAKEFRYLDGKVVKGVINLDGASVSIVPSSESNGRPYCFKIIDPASSGLQRSPVVIFSSSTESEQLMWFNSIYSVIEKIKCSKDGPQYESFGDVVSK